MSTMNASTFHTAIGSAVTQGGQSLAQLSRSAPTLVVFLRHLGCTFCREALADVARARPELEAAGTAVVLVHQSSEEDAAAFFAGYGLGDVARISDPDLTLYRAFGLRRGHVGQLLSPKVVARAGAALLRGHGPGRPHGDTRQMPGVFLLHDGEVAAAFRHETAADRPDYTGIARCDGGVCDVAA